MRKSWIRFSFALMGVTVLVGSAAAQASVSYWFNTFGDPSGNQPSVINVTQGTPITLSIYLRTQGIGALSGINVMFGYSTTTTVGSGATRSDSASHMADETAFTWAQADLTSGNAFQGTGGGGGPASGTTRPWGYFASTFTLGTFSNTADNTNFHVADITLSILAAPGTDIPVSVWSFANTDNYASAVVNSNSSEFFPSQPYNATLHVQGVPEPASIAFLSLGAAALLRRRRK